MAPLVMVGGGDGSFVSMYVERLGDRSWTFAVGDRVRRKYAGPSSPAPVVGQVVKVSTGAVEVLWADLRNEFLRAVDLEPVNAIDNEGVDAARLRRMDADLGGVFVGVTPPPLASLDLLRDEVRRARRPPYACWYSAVPAWGRRCADVSFVGHDGRLVLDRAGYFGNSGSLTYDSSGAVVGVFVRISTALDVSIIETRVEDLFEDLD